MNCSKLIIILQQHFYILQKLDFDYIKRNQDLIYFLTSGLWELSQMKLCNEVKIIYFFRYNMGY